MENRNNLDILLKGPTAHDIIAAIFAYSELKKFTNHRKEIQTFVRRNKVGQAAKLLKPFVFSKGVDVYPYSRDLESALNSLFSGGIISTWGPHYDGYYMEDEIREEVMRQTEERFSQQDLTILKNLGRKWWRFNKSFFAIGVIMALLVFLPGEFPNNIEVIHTTIKRLRGMERYEGLLMDFNDFVDYRFPFSLSLERILNILKGAGGCINLLSPDFDVCIVSSAQREILRRDVLNKHFNEDEQVKLKEIASELKSALGC